MDCQLDLFTGAPCVELNVRATNSAYSITSKSDAEDVLLELLKILENELYHSGNARLLAAEVIRLYFEADRP